MMSKKFKKNNSGSFPRNNGADGNSSYNPYQQFYQENNIIPDCHRPDDNFYCSSSSYMNSPYQHESENNYQGTQNNDKPKPRKGHPKGLKGKEIGLWYRNQQVTKNKKWESNYISQVGMNEENANKVQSVLNKFSSDHPSTSANKESKFAKTLSEFADKNRLSVSVYGDLEIDSALNMSFVCLICLDKKKQNVTIAKHNLKGHYIRYHHHGINNGFENAYRVDDLETEWKQSQSLGYVVESNGEANQNETEDEKIILKCRKCKAVFKGREAMRKHKLEHRMEKPLLKCLLCQKMNGKVKYIKPKLAAKHWKNKHGYFNGKFEEAFDRHEPEKMGGNTQNNFKTDKMIHEVQISHDKQESMLEVIDNIQSFQPEDEEILDAFSMRDLDHTSKRNTSLADNSDSDSPSDGENDLDDDDDDKDKDNIIKEEKNEDDVVVLDYSSEAQLNVVNDHHSSENFPKSSAESFLQSNAIQIDSDEEADQTNLIELDNFFKESRHQSDFDVKFFISNPLKNRGYSDRDIENNEVVNKELLDKFEFQKNEKKYIDMMRFRKTLPSWNQKYNIIELINSNQVSVISGETGCGKTTQVPQFILDDYLSSKRGSQCNIVCTQPRRISAISVALRVAEERAEKVGRNGSVGYQIRLESSLPRDAGSILFCTTGIILKRLINDRYCRGVSHIILDEIHERDILSDFLLIILKDLITVRKDIKIILMSATLKADIFSNYYENAPLLTIPGFTYPVKEFYLEQIIDNLCYWDCKNKKRMKRNKKITELDMEHEEWLNSLRNQYDNKTIKTLTDMDMEIIDLDLVSNLIVYLCKNKPEGAILVFLPGWSEISNLHNQLGRNPMIAKNRHIIIPLHSMMPTGEQGSVFKKPPAGIRKIVLATNIAETSITIEDVVYVVDGGKIKLKGYDAVKNMSDLLVNWISRANAKQRRGRAGRVQPGECYKLYTTFNEMNFDDYLKPEILRTRLEELCLQIKLLKLGKIKEFISKALDTPPVHNIDNSIKLLTDMKALTEEETLTPLGYHLAQMPLDPQVGKMILFGAIFSCIDPILTIAASLSFKTAFYCPLGQEKEVDIIRRKLAGDSESDHIMLHNAYKGWEKSKQQNREGHYCWDNFLSKSTLQMLQGMRKQLAEILFKMQFLSSPDPSDDSNNRNSGNDRIVKSVICAGLYPNIAKLTKPPSNRSILLRTLTEQRVVIHPKSVNANSKWFSSIFFIYHSIMKTSAVYIHDTTPILPFSVLLFGGKFNLNETKDKIVVDDWIIFKSTEAIANIFSTLRKEMDQILLHKINNPGVTTWNINEKEGAVLQAIIDTIASEEVKSPLTITTRI